MLRSQQIELTIDELILDGFNNIDESSVRRIAAQKLTNLLNQRSINNTTTESKTITAIDAQTFSIADNASSETIGNEVAQAIYGSLNL